MALKCMKMCGMVLIGVTALVPFMVKQSVYRARWTLGEACTASHKAMASNDFHTVLRDTPSPDHRRIKVLEGVYSSSELKKLSEGFNRVVLIKDFLGSNRINKTELRVNITARENTLYRKVSAAEDVCECCQGNGNVSFTFADLKPDSWAHIWDATGLAQEGLFLNSVFKNEITGAWTTTRHADAPWQLGINVFGTKVIDFFMNPCTDLALSQKQNFAIWDESEVRCKYIGAQGMVVLHEGDAIFWPMWTTHLVHSTGSNTFFQFRGSQEGFMFQHTTKNLAVLYQFFARKPDWASVYADFSALLYRDRARGANVMVIVLPCSIHPCPSESHAPSEIQANDFLRGTRTVEATRKTNDRTQSTLQSRSAL